MADAVTACRVCLAGDVRLLTIAGALQLVYEKITSNALHSEGKPVAACYICYAQLDKCRKLMLTCAIAENVLNDMLHRHAEITKGTISLIDRKAHGLCGSLTCSGTVHHNYDLPAPMVIKTEPESDMANTEPVRTEEEPEQDPLQLDNMCDTEWASDEEDPISLSQPCNAEMDTPEQNERVEVQTSGAAKQKQGDSSTTNSKQYEFRLESTTQTARGRHQCDVCQKQFRCNVEIVRHMRTHTGEKPFQCNICRKRFRRKHHLRRHLETHDEKTPLQCYICKHSFNQTSDLLTHICDGEKPRQPVISKSDKSKKRFKCNSCQYKSSHKIDFTRHVRTHTGEKPFQCNICDYRCSHKSNLVAHVKSHKGKTPFQCKHCDFRSYHKSSLTAHIIRTHPGEKPYQCEVCQHKFVQKHHLLNHLRTHTGEKPFQCMVCDYRCKQKSYLVTHIRTHTGEKPFECDVCQHRFVRKYQLQLHMKTH
ncbi:zinc finger protein OZF-like isoform X2 [Plodia interpunctella]|uniref:zinc finger protein OZF-like isoform X2 n=1 Tax=Plodia interpunctella TaxID=58824 RepID=UPI002367EB8E|nr:zinc finger protein OZF-like isoform X2 [Plodia interpunctella]